MATSAQPYNFKCPNLDCGAEYVAVQREQGPQSSPRCIECTTPFLAKERGMHIHYEAAWPVTPLLPELSSGAA
jgi:hypothetical protein